MGFRELRSAAKDHEIQKVDSNAASGIQNASYAE